MPVEAVNQPEDPPSFLSGFHTGQGECFLLAFTGAQGVRAWRHSGRTTFILPVQFQREGQPDSLAPPLEAVALEIAPRDCDGQEDERQHIIDGTGGLVLGGQQGLG